MFGNLSQNKSHCDTILALLGATGSGLRSEFEWSRELCYHFFTSGSGHMCPGLSEYYLMNIQIIQSLICWSSLKMCGHRELWVMSQSLQHPRWCKYQAAKNLMAAFVKCLTVLAKNLCIHFELITICLATERRGSGLGAINVFSAGWITSCVAQHHPRHAAIAHFLDDSCSEARGCKIVWWCCLY